MKRLFTLLMVVAFAISVFAASASGLGYDPLGRNDVRCLLPTDDSSWIDEKSSDLPDRYYIWSFLSGSYFYFTTFFVIGLITVPDADMGGDGTGNNETDDAGTTLEDRGPSSR